MREGSLTVTPLLPESPLAQAASNTTETAQHEINRDAHLTSLIIPIPIIRE
jgi:hypothetical protein